MTLTQFLSSIAALKALDHWTLEQGGVINNRGPAPERRRIFMAYQKDPLTWFLSADKPTQERLWAMIESAPPPPAEDEADAAAQADGGE